MHVMDVLQVKVNGRYVDTRNGYDICVERFARRGRIRYYYLESGMRDSLDGVEFAKWMVPKLA